MKKIIIEKPGSYDKLLFKEFPDPQPTDNEVLIDCRACGVNFADCCVRMGVYSYANQYMEWPITPGFEVSGVIKDMGKGVSGLKRGQKVLAITRFGGYSTQISVKQDYVFPLPEKMSFEEGAGFPAAFLTAGYALHFLSHPRKGQSMLVHSAAGGVGSCLVQLGKIAGCTVIGVVGAPNKIEAVKQLGADGVIDKSSTKLWKEAERFFPGGYDIILDANGPETFSDSYKHLSPGGKLVVYGMHTMLSKKRGTVNILKALLGYLRTPRFNPLSMIGENHSVLAFNLVYLFDNQKLFKEEMDRLLLWFKEGKLHLPMITTFDLEKAGEAHQAMETGETIGKLVLKI